MDEIARALSLSSLFAGCDAAKLRFELRRFPSGRMLSDCPAGVSSVGLVTRGRVDVYSVALDGRDVLLSSLGAGECFGICNLLADGEMETVLRCGVDTHIAYISKSCLLGLLHEDVEFALRYAALCNEKLQFLLGKIELLTVQSCRGKLISWLTLHADARGMVAWKASRDELARHLSVSRAALFRELGSLQECGAVRAQENGFQILDRQRLEDRMRETENA